LGFEKEAMFNKSPIFYFQFFSAYSIENALAMPWAGEKNTAAQQMVDALDLALPRETFHPTLNALNLDLNSRDDQPRLRPAMR
jgi:serine protease inhibitor